MANVVQLVIQGVDRSQGSFSSLTKSLSSLQAAVAKATPMIAGLGAAGAAAFAAMVKQSIDAADEAGKLAQKVGLTTEQLTSLQHAANLSNVSNEALKIAFKELSEEVQSGGRKLAAFGVQIADSSGQLKSNEALFLEIADRFADMADGSAKTTAAVKLFGKAGTDLIPLLNSGASGIREFQSEAHKLGLTISSRTAREAEAFNDNLTRLRETFRGLANRITAELTPGLVELSEKAVKITSEFLSTESAGGTLIAVVRELAKEVKLLDKDYGILAVSAASASTTLKLNAASFMAGMGAARLFGSWVETAGSILKDRFTGNLSNAGERLREFARDAEQTLRDTQARIENLFNPTPVKTANAAPSRQSVLKNTRTVNTTVTEVEFGPEQEPWWFKQHEKQRQETQKFLADIARAHQEATLSRIQLLHREREAKLRQLDEMAVAEEDWMVARADLNATYDKRISEARAHAHEEEKRRYEDQTRMLTSVNEMAAELNAQRLGEFDQRRAASEAQHHHEIQQLIETGLHAEQINAAATASYLAHQKRISDIQAAENAVRLQNQIQNMHAMAGAFGNLASVAQAFGKKGFAAYKAFASAEAVISAIAGATRAYKDVPWPLNIVVSGAILAAGMANVARINSTNPVGQAHAGMTNIPTDGTWFLKGGERIVPQEQNTDLTRFLAQATETPRAIVIPVYLDGKKIAESIHDWSRNGQLEIHARAIRS